MVQARRGDIPLQHACSPGPYSDNASVAQHYEAGMKPLAPKGHTDQPANAKRDPGREQADQHLPRA